MRIKPHYLNPFFFIRGLRSIYLSGKVTEKNEFVPIRLGSPFLTVRIIRHPTASFVLRGKLSISAYQNGNDPVSISLGRNSVLIIDGDFTIGNGTRISLSDSSSLYLGGKKYESGSGITEQSRIMVRKNMHIGKDCIIAWNVFISDCDWHEIEGKSIQSDVFIGNHVWIAGNSSILKGSRIGDGCIVGTHSVVMNQSFPDKCLVAGNPAKILARNQIWHRDMSVSPERLGFMPDNFIEQNKNDVENKNTA